MEDKEKHELALFRFSLIAPLANETYEAASKNEFFRVVASKEHTLPNGTTARFSSGTVKKWFLNYKHGGFDALIPKARADVGQPRNIDSNAIAKIHELKGIFPYITGTLVYQKLVEEGYVKESKTSLATVLRYIRENNLKRSQIIPIDRKAFEMEFANDCWQSDTSHGPVIKVNGQKRQAYLITFLDDASRLILHGEFFFNDNAVNMQTVFKMAISKYGLPKRIFVDNGKTYKNDQLGLICASLGIELIHTKAYSPESKGKIERSFRTIKDNWINGIDWNDYSSLEELNTDFNKYLNEKYINIVHSSIKTSPRARYLENIDRIKFIPIEELDNHFLHRVSRKVNNDATIQLYCKQFEVPAKYVGQRINIRYSPIDLDKAYIFNKDNKMVETVYPLNRVDNSKIKRNIIDYSLINGGNEHV
jgi:transposase InsO family protein